MCKGTSLLPLAQSIFHFQTSHECFAIQWNFITSECQTKCKWLTTESSWRRFEEDFLLTWWLAYFRSSSSCFPILGTFDRTFLLGTFWIGSRKRWLGTLLLLLLRKVELMLTRKRQSVKEKIRNFAIFEIKKKKIIIKISRLSQRQ